MGVCIKSRREPQDTVYPQEKYIITVANLSTAKLNLQLVFLVD